MRARKLLARRIAAKKRSHNTANAYPTTKETAGISEDHAKMIQYLETTVPCPVRSAPTLILTAWRLQKVASEQADEMMELH